MLSLSSSSGNVDHVNLPSVTHVRSDMDFEPSTLGAEYQERVRKFLDARVYPAEAAYHQAVLDSGDPHHHPFLMEELKSEARELGLWNLFHPHAELGPG